MPSSSTPAHLRQHRKSQAEPVGSSGSRSAIMGIEFERRLFGTISA
jgi:hypothetical protein